MCIRDSPDRQNIYSCALGLYNARIVKMVNRKGRLKCSILVDEVPTLYFKGLDTLIATARSNKVAVCLGAQDFSQLIRDYGDKEARVIQNTIGNIFSGQVVGETAKNLSERFGKVLQQRKSINMTREDTSTNISTQLDSLIPDVYKRQCWDWPLTVKQPASGMKATLDSTTQKKTVSVTCCRH